MRRLSVAIVALALLVTLGLAFWPVEAGGSITFGCGSAVIPSDEEAVQAGELVRDAERLDDMLDPSQSEGLFGDAADDAAVAGATDRAVAACEDARNGRRLVTGIVFAAGLAVAAAALYVGGARQNGASHP